MVKNAGQVALEMGNSAAIVMKHYTEIVVDARAAREYWSSNRCRKATGRSWRLLKTRAMLLLIVADHLRRRAAHLDLRAHLLQARCKRFNLLLLPHGSRLEVLLLLFAELGLRIK